MNKEEYKIVIKEDTKYGAYYYIATELNGVEIDDAIGYKDLYTAFEVAMVLLESLNNEKDLELDDDSIEIEPGCFENYQDTSIDYFIENGLINYGTNGRCTIDVMEMIRGQNSFMAKYIPPKKKTKIKPQLKGKGKVIKLKDYNTEH